MKLSNRMTEIVKMVKKNSMVADIGTDHGLIPAYLTQFGIAKKVIATDISFESLKKTISYVEEMGLEHEIDTRCGDGLETIKPYEVDTIIISGMGGILIKEIIEKHYEVARSASSLILQPMTASDELRKYLLENGYIISDEVLVKDDNKYYEIIMAESGINTMDYYDYKLSPYWIKQPGIFREFLELRINEKLNIIDSMGENLSDRVKQKREEYLEEIITYRRGIMSIEGK